MENAFTKTPSQALEQFGVTEGKGLSEQQVQSSRQKHGKNGMFRSTPRREMKDELTQGDP
jgi:Ca2+ transporting ATPase